MRNAIAERPVAVDGGLIPVTVSVGIAIAHHAGEAHALMGAADAALYRAKAEGRNRVITAGDEERVDNPVGRGCSGQSL